MTTEERIAKAARLREMGYNCAQAVMMSFDDVTGLDDSTAAIMCASLGAGVASGEICGVANAMAIVQGFAIGDGSPDGKKEAMPAAKRLLAKFASASGGCVTCRDLKGKCGKSCSELIESGIKICDAEVTHAR